jgi:2-desacetyl-2-hydroxyethyl bacteriochlorophyllide A dehydrogenase
VNAAVLRAPRTLVVESRPPLAPLPGEVIVRVGQAGLCGTDDSIWAGDRVVSYPRVMGHELVGRVEATGAGVVRVRDGDRVVVEPNYSCGSCRLCREGNRNLCAGRVAIGIDVDGGFAESVRVPERCCWVAGREPTDDALLLVEPLAVVTRAVGRGAPRPGERAAVVGAGTLGLLALQILRARGASVLVLGRTARRFDMARRLGADAVRLVGEAPAADAARDFSGGEGIDLVVETAGTAAAVGYALDLVRPGGRLVLTGLPHEPTPVPFFSVVRREITILGSMIYQDEFGEALRLLEDGHVRTTDLITHRFPLADIERAFAAHRDPASIKVTLTVTPS